MEKRYNFFDFATHTMVIFALSVIILNIFSLIFGNDAEGYSAIFVLGNRGISAEIVFQFLALSALITGTRFTFFTYTFFKCMTISLRTICMVTAGIVEVALFVIFFNWFPANSWKPWLGFLICFGVCFVVSFLVMILKEKMENRKLDEALKDYKRWRIMNMTYTIKAVELSHSYSDNLVLENVSLKVRPGEIFGLLGPSGAGKTTLIKILTGQLIQKAGYAELLGMDTRKLRDLERSKISAMMDSYGLYERLSVYDNLSFYADIYHVPRSRISSILSNLGLYKARKTPVSKLSKGMKNRLSLARALLNNADVLFLDEPTSGVDPTTAREIHSVLKEQKEKGTTIFLTTHNMFEAESLCDYIALLSNGNIVEQGTPAEICKKYNYLNRIEITLKNGDRVSIANESASAGLLKDYLENEDIETIHSTEPTLETVFVELTGKALSGYE